MRNWRELGEVPDSDDDSFDDTEFHDNDLPEQLPKNDVDGAPGKGDGVHTAYAKDDDIWDVPSSSPRQSSPSLPTFHGQASQLLSQPPWSAQPIRKKRDALTALPPSSENGADTPASSAENGHHTTTTFPQDEISTGYVRVTTPDLLPSSPASILSRTPTPPLSPSLPRLRVSPPPASLGPPQDYGQVQDEEEELSRQTAVRLERSLRPRKPIQQHPYALENAQYATFMKSHGVKPIRVVQGPRQERGEAEEDSQDQEFQAEESQEGSAQGLAGLEDSGPILFDDDEDELALTPSLPKTSPHGQGLRTSSQQTGADHTDATSLSDDEFPTLERLHPMSAKKRQRILKRQRSQLLSSTQRKRPRFVPDSSSQGSPQRPTFIQPPPPTIWDLSSSPPDPPPLETPPPQFGAAPRLPAQRRPRKPDPSVREPASTAASLDDGDADAPIAIDEDTQSDLGDGDLTDSTDSSGSESEVVRQNIRRIRGVLPASWLRIDQQQNKPAARDARRRSPEPSPDRNIRRGVALPRQGLSRPSSTAPLMLFESDESEDELPRREGPADEPAHITPSAIFTVEDDGASVVEEDTIDWMLPGRKRAGSHSTSSRMKKKQKQSETQSVFKGRADHLSRQPKITQVLNRSKHGAASTSAKRDSITQRRHHGGAMSNRRAGKRATTPPLLSILDVVEPDAPRFVKIAARSVKNKANLGKASPSKKVISLATRSDNVDALSVLRDWKSGKTKPKVTAPPPKKPAKPKNRPALREISTNPTARPRGAQPQKLARQSSLAAFVRVGEGNELLTPQPQPSSALKPSEPFQARDLNLHPAQLEEDESEDKRRRLNARKRKLDAFYRRRRTEVDASTESGLAQNLDVNFTLQEPLVHERHTDVHVVPDTEEVSAPTIREKTDARSRFRKRHRPQRVDPEAPQYARANDPLPVDFSVVEPQEHHPPDKLKGLGPYGTQYTHHFEIFPLDRGVFFHESTIIGRGLLRDAVDAGLSDRIRHQRPTVSLLLDGRPLRWGPWNDNTSSELGILVDWVTEQLVASLTTDESTGRKAVEAADFVLGYILRSLSVQSDVEEKAFVSRYLEVFSSFVSRFESIEWSTVPIGARRTQLEVAARICLSMLAVRSLSQSSSSDFMQSMKLDELLKQSATATIRRLVECGTEDLRTLYADLQRATFRERGIRPDHFIANCWVAMIGLLEAASIPRSSFWDVTQAVMLSRRAAPDSDVQVFERLWHDMFTLLPLCEVDSSGLLVSGIRHTAPVEGWTLPQQLLKRVFQLYQANPRQPPGFIDYCRSLVTRCHFLVEQWGWRKCTGVIGTIFDFFGSQSLGHLRNEEVYKSPRFLEELDRRPSLSIEPEDRCFHIFIKLLALTIQRLRGLGRVNDIKNLVARTLPNHNRQYLKEDTIHQHDLAALRNHHDLLCTLFWVSPPDLRPAVHLIEKLVVPGSAHKEACLINVRAWNQLARFMISNGEGGAAFRPLAAWRNNVFNQVLDQYLSAASDIEQQFRALSSEASGISKAFRDEMVAKNKATALDVLHCLGKASLDVLQRAPTLAAALYALNTGQLQKVFTSLDYQSPGFDWSTLRVALDTLEHLLSRIDGASEEQYSSEFSDNLDAPHLEDAVLLVNEHLTKDFFWMCRTTLALPLNQSLRQHNAQSACAEKTVTLAAKIAVRFIKNRVTQLLSFFSAGKYSLFPDVPKNLDIPERRYLPLFLAVLVKNHIFDFKDLRTNILGLWILSIVKPQRLLGYENYLAEVLKKHNLPFLDRATVAVGIPPDYNSNIDFFACAIHYMRKTLLASNSTQAKPQRDEFSKTLQLAMHRIKDDLSLLRVQQHPAEHAAYVDFARQAISLVKSHGVGICAVDPFFTQPSADYAPPVQDPQLHTAGIVAYGVRLGERDVTAAPQLFHYLLNNFKIALGNDGVAQECAILGRAMRADAHVLSFVLQYMLPAVVRASSAQAGEGGCCWALLEVYVVALASVLDGGCVPRELAGEEDVEHAAGVLGDVVAWFEGLRTAVVAAAAAAALSLQQVHVMTLLVAVANLLRPSLMSYLFNGRGPAVPGLQDTVDRLTTIFAELRGRVEELLALPDAGLAESHLSVTDLLSGVAFASSGSTSTVPGARNPRVQDFANTIISDVRRNWVVSGERVMVRMAAGRGTQGGLPAMTLTQAAVGGGSSSAGLLRGTEYVPWEIKEVLGRLNGELGEWMEECGARVGGRERAQRLGGEMLLF